MPTRRCRRRRSPPGPGSTPFRIPPPSAAGSCASSGARPSIGGDRSARGSSDSAPRPSDDRPMEFAAADPSPDALLISRELEIAIAQVVKALPRKLRDPFLMAASGDHRYEEIATLLAHSDRHGQVADLRSAPPDPHEARSPRPRRSAMNTNRDRLDDAIDAGRRSHDARERRRRARLAHHDALAGALGVVAGIGWVPRLAIIAASLSRRRCRSTNVRRSFYERSTSTFDGVLRRSVGSCGTGAPNVVEPTLNVRRTIVEPSSNVRRTIDGSDFDRSLPALEAARVLAFDSLAPASLPEDAPLTLKPLEIADLPLTADSFSPR